jgi:hypothetical protein
VQQRHFDGEGEEVVDEGVERFVHHGARGHVCDGLEAVIDVERGNLGDRVSRIKSRFGAFRTRKEVSLPS